ncbi:methyltransferase domain-containing protein [Desulforudis sp. 1088]|uniref:methyltransferase domain-containing protein n=1 Tax=unclassified Candidatus Desulforudis TaxID=2635950 RepID=UPI003CE5C143
MSVAAVFSVHSEIYATPVNECFYARIATALANKIQARLNPARILEVGAGTGAATIVLRRYFPSAAILSTDPSPAMLAHNRGKGVPGVRYVCAAAEELGGLTERFDLVFGNLCYHWFTPQTARQITSLLRPGGVMAFSVPVTGVIQEEGNRVLVQICRELGVRQPKRMRLPSPQRLRREFAFAPQCTVEVITLRETHPPALFGTLLRARGSWAFLFGPQAAERAEALWRKLTAGVDQIVLCWQIALVVAEL